MISSFWNLQFWSFQGSSEKEKKNFLDSKNWCFFPFFSPSFFMLCTFLTAKVIQVENFDFFHQHFSFHILSKLDFLLKLKLDNQKQQQFLKICFTTSQKLFFTRGFSGHDKILHKVPWHETNLNSQKARRNFQKLSYRTNVPLRTEWKCILHTNPIELHFLNV